MDLAVQLQELIEDLDDSEKTLLIEIAKKFLQYDDDDDVLSEEDLHYIQLGKEEYARGETISHNDRKWK